MTPCERLRIVSLAGRAAVRSAWQKKGQTAYRRVLGLLLILMPYQLSARCQGNQTPNYFTDWFQRVDQTQAQQPRWITPLATTTPRLEEEFRYDILWQTNTSGAITENYGGSKGLELIPFRRVEVILSVPPYFVHNISPVSDGFGDFQFLIKYRLLSSNEKRGNCILTAFLGMSLPTGTHGNGALHPIVTPTIAYGKGFGPVDLQGTFGTSLPTADTRIIGRTYPWNNAFQYRLPYKVWPEIEVNTTFFQQGKNDGRTQVFITPGVVVGRFPVWKRLNITIGAGFQVAATRFYTTNHNGILSVRFPF